ncbi:MAG: DUF1572 family protein [Acidobacteria bacterium]|nr:DUF1572 family protein [Acidobacteriota bacterium]
MEISQTFINGSQTFLKNDFLPKIEACVERLTDEEIWWRANEESNSIGNLILHLSGNVRQWIISGLGNEPDHRIRQEEFDERSHIPKQELILKLKTAVEEASEVLKSLDPKILLENRKIQGKDISVIYAIYHVVEHFAMHTGQILLLTKLNSNKEKSFYNISEGLPRAKW